LDGHGAAASVAASARGKAAAKEEAARSKEYMRTRDSILLAAIWNLDRDEGCLDVRGRD
jgi:hypothetical protein